MNYLPPPQPILNKDIRLSGDVEIHPTASLAPGVILQAASDSRIVVGADVCIGMGVIISACHGLIEIESGAILGSGVLIIGSGKIGHNSCIGTSTTIYQENIAPMAVIEPGSIIGDISRQVSKQDRSDSKPVSPSQSKPDEHLENKHTSNGNTTSPDGERLSVDRSFKNKHPSEPKNASQSVRFSGTYYFKEKSEQTSTQDYSQNIKTTPIPHVDTPVKSMIQKSKVPVVGQVYINELLVTLFPHRKDFGSDS